ncbi:MAG: chromosomal replication initiator protein DnaA [Candidatus Moranbacteria bacterium]|nr:chromosomal replication initiator protein DnaA [Candidatus Moranbacteria bacterium]
MNEKQIWKAVLNEIELSISRAHFVTWFKKTFIHKIDKSTMIIAVPNAFGKEWLDRKYSKKILAIVKKYKSGITSLKFEVIPGERLSNKNRSIKRSQIDRGSKKAVHPQNIENNIFKSTLNNINPRYTFDNLVEGSHNELAKAASEAVSISPGEKYNPLFIYGGVGLGKTHLLQAIGNKLKKEKPDFLIQYVTSERFTNDFVFAVKEKRLEEFKNIYRIVDILLIDDIQFIGGKEGTQEQFFHTFNNLYQNNKQIVLCSDRPPKSIPALEDRLCSRFEGGMVVDVTKPNTETRIAILIEKAENQNFPIPMETLNYIAENISNNVRELEGALNRFIANCQLKKLSPNVENAKTILGKDIRKMENRTKDPDFILQTIGDFYKVEPDKIKGKSRKSEIVKPRQVAVFILRKKIKASFPVIGKILGNRDHTTTLHAFNKISNEIKKDALLKQEIEEINCLFNQ